MKILPRYSSRPVLIESSETDEAVDGLQASIRSSDSLKGILDRARDRYAKQQGVDGDKLRTIERICTRYEEHQKAVRDHCLDYYNSVPTQRQAPGLRERTSELVEAGRELYNELRKAILSSY
ncbi:MAG TPA: hypothetical protein PKI32_06600 [Opitutales bacterium]|nr:hypothetical protein [Opitutales bacterium]